MSNKMVPVFELRRNRKRKKMKYFKDFNTLNIEYEGQLHIKWKLTNMEWVKVLRRFESYPKCNVDATVIALLGMGLNVSRMFFFVQLIAVVLMDKIQCRRIQTKIWKGNAWNDEHNHEWFKQNSNTDYCRHYRSKKGECWYAKNSFNSSKRNWHSNHNSIETNPSENNETLYV